MMGGIRSHRVFSYVVEKQSLDTGCDQDIHKQYEHTRPAKVIDQQGHQRQFDGPAGSKGSDQSRMHTLLLQISEQWIPEIDGSMAQNAPGEKSQNTRIR